MSPTRQSPLHNLGHKSSFTVTIITKESLHANPDTHTHKYNPYLRFKKLVFRKKILRYIKKRKDVVPINYNILRTFKCVHKVCPHLH